MNKLKAKLNKQGGFTMVEMLIVVAIIAILIAISIPMFNNALEGARHGVDQANMRDAISLATVQYMTDSAPETTFKTGKIYNYCVGTSADGHEHQGYLEPVGTTTGAVAPKCTCATATAAHTLQVTIKAPGTADNGKPQITLNWTTVASTDATNPNATQTTAIKTTDPT